MYMSIQIFVSCVIDELMYSGLPFKLDIDLNGTYLFK